MSAVDTGRIQQAMRDEVDCEICDKVSIDAIPGIFADVQEIPEPSSFDPILTNLEAAMATLSYHSRGSNDAITQLPQNANPNLGYVESVSDELEEWTGEAMEAYRDNIKTPFPFYIDNIYLACTTIYGAVLAEKALWKSVREDLKDLEDKAVSACEKLDDTGASTGAFTLTCVAAVVGVAGAILTAPTGGLAAPVTIAAVTGILSIAGSAATTDFDIEHADELVEALRGEVNKIKTNITESEQEIQKSMSDLLGALDSPQGLLAFQGPLGFGNGPGDLGDRR